MAKKIEATWNRAGLNVRLHITPATSTSRWGLTIDEAKELHRTLGLTISEADRHLVEVRAADALRKPAVKA